MDNLRDNIRTYPHKPSYNTGTQEVKGSCLSGLNQPDMGSDYYASTQDGYGDYILGKKDYKTCKAWAKAQWAVYEAMPDNDGTNGYTEKTFIAKSEEVECYSTKNDDDTYYGQRCGASFTGSSMAALFGLLCVSLALW